MNFLPKSPNIDSILVAINQTINQNGLACEAGDLVTKFEYLRKVTPLVNLGFISIEDKWHLEHEWIGYDELRDYLEIVVHPVRAYKLWIELFSDSPFYSWKNKPIWWTIQVKPTNMVSKLAPKLIGRTILLMNRAKHFAEKGFSGDAHFRKGTVAEFNTRFIEKLSMDVLGIVKKKKFIDLRKELFHQFKLKYENLPFNDLIRRKQRPNLYILKYNVLKLNYCWIRKFHEDNRKHTWRGDKGARKVIEFFNAFNYSKSLKGEPVEYVITSSKISFDNLISKLKRNEISNLSDILFALKKPRDNSRVFINEYIGTKDVKPPLSVNTLDNKKFKKETNPKGQIAVVQSLFHRNQIIKKLNKNYNIRIPLNGVYKFMGQKRGRLVTNTTVFEDISACFNKPGTPFPLNVNILVKNSSEFIGQRLIEDRLFKIISFPPKEKSIFFNVDVFHPDNLNIYELPRCVSQAITNYKGGYPLGWIDIGMYHGVETEAFLASVYGAIKYARSKKGIDNHVEFAEKMLLKHEISDVPRDLIMTMDALFDRHKIILSTPRDLCAKKFVIFTKDFIRTFLMKNTK